MIVHALGRLPRTLVGLGVLATFALLTAAFPAAWPLGLLVQGAGFGAAAGLLAVGLVLTYQTTRVINFSYGAMGSCGAMAGIVAYQEFGVPWAFSFLVALAFGAALGGATHLLFQRFSTAPRLVVTVATIGLLQIFVGLQFGIAFWGSANVLVPRFSTGLSDHTFTVGSSLFTGNDVLATLLVPVALVGLSAFLFRTESGVAVRAVADNRERAELLGIPVRRLSLITWVLVGILGSAVLFANAPMNGLPASPFVATGGIFLPALAAAIVARMEQLALAFSTGVLLGIFNAVIANNVHKTALGTVVMLVVVLAALLARKWDLSRAERAESSWAFSGVVRPIPAEISSLIEYRIAKFGLLGALGAVALLIPTIAGPARTHTMAGHLIVAIAALSLVVLSGWSGTVSLGQVAIVGTGAVAAGNLISKLNLDLFLVLIASALVGGLVAVVIGLPALRVRPLFLAVTTLAFAASMDQYFLNPSNYPSAIPGFVDRPVLWQRIPLSSERALYFLILGVLLALVVVLRVLRRTRPGRVLLASRDNELATEAMAISTTRVRVAGMVVAGMVAGIAGALAAVLEQGVGASSFPAQDSVTVFSIAVVGGLSSVSGALLGVGTVQGLTLAIGAVTSQGAQFASLGTGALLLAVLLVSPGGLGALVDGVRGRFARAIGARHGIAFDVGAAAGSTLAAPSVVAPSVREVPGLLECDAITASYGPLQVLFGVDLTVQAGEVVALLGTNGAGKSTVFKAITGLLGGSGGDVRLGGESIAGLSTDEIARRGLTMMPGGRGVFPTMTIDSNLQVACWQVPRSEREDVLREVLEMFPVLAERRQQRAGDLSGGEQQQLSLAMAFVTKPKLLLIDELSLGLAPVIVGKLCEKVRQIHAAGTTVIVVEQSVNVALELAERAVFLEKGAVRFEGPTADLLDRPDVLRSVFIGDAVGGGNVLDDADGESTAEGGEPAVLRGALRCDRLRKTFGGLVAVNDVDLEIAPGEIVGLVGHNGAGKTTLFDVISGFHAADGGSILLGDTDLTHLPPHRRAVAGLGRSFQEARLFPSLSVLETVVVARDQHQTCREWLAPSLSLPASIDAEFESFLRAQELVDLLGLTGYASTPISDLSTGTRRIVEFACVLAMDPEVILLDEPSAGVAQKDTEALGPLLRRVRAATGSSIVIIEHDMALLASLCDRLVALELGTVICDGPPDDVLAHPVVVSSYLGTDPAAIQRSGSRAGNDTGEPATTSGATRTSGRRRAPLQAAR